MKKRVIMRRVKVSDKKKFRNRDKSIHIPVLIFLFVLLFSFLIVFFALQEYSRKIEIRPGMGELPSIGIIKSLFSGEGSGTADDPFQITICSQLDDIEDNPGAYYILVQDVDCSGFDLEPLGSPTNNFLGNLDGKEYSIKNLLMNRPDEDNVALFEYISSSGTVKNLHLDNMSIISNARTGAVAGRNYGSIMHVHATINITANHDMGGLVGENHGVIINSSVRENSLNIPSSINGIIKGSLNPENVGGLVGQNYGSIIGCYAGANIYGQKNVGGLVGESKSDEVAGTIGIVENSHSNGSIFGPRTLDNAGGLVGHNFATVKNSYSSSSVIIIGYDPINPIQDDVGGVIGNEERGSSRIQSFHPNDVLVMGETNSGGEVPPENIRSVSTLESLAWNFPPWSRINNHIDFPILEWEANIPIGSCSKLSEIRNHLRYSYYLIRDIDCDVQPFNRELGWEPIGDYLNKFEGVLDGRDYAIKHLYINRQGADDVGLFGCTGTNAIIKNIDLLDMNITDADSRVGSLVGNNSGLINNTYVENFKFSSKNPMSAANKNIGGLVGVNWGVIYKCYVNRGNITHVEEDIGGVAGENNGKIISSYAIVNITIGNPGDNDVGGLVGHNKETGYINRSYSSGIVNGGSLSSVLIDQVGGLVGKNSGWIEESYSNAVILGDDNVGGLVGENDAITSNIKNSYSFASNVTGNKKVGGLVGKHSFGSITNCYSISNVTGVAGITNIGGLVSRLDSGITTSSYYAYDAIKISPAPSPTSNGYLIGRESRVNIINTDWLSSAPQNWLFPPWSNINNNEDFPILFWQLPPTLNSIGDKSAEINTLLEFNLASIDNNEDIVVYSFRLYNDSLDINRDGLLDNEDNELMLDAMSNPNPDADINKDGAVNIEDLNSFNSNFNNKPGGVSFSSTIGSFSWIPDAVGAYRLTFSAAKKINSKSFDSEIITITVNPSPPAPPGPPGGGGGGGGGAVGYWKNTFDISDEQFKRGYSKELAVKERIKFKIGVSSQSAGVEELNTKGVLMNISFRSQKVLFKSGEEKKFDVNLDGYYDIYAKVNSIANDKASLTVKSIHELTSAAGSGANQSNINQTPGDITPAEVPKGTIDWMLYIILSLIAIIVIAIAIVFVYFIFEKKKSKN